ncbi:ankycorbin isoform X1 [Tribolium castaneum]|uniref:ankycorbin isoform X1 n=1 Tax=Tribolium castaneum TaxID=7070 RepID=UPI00077DCC54|nr:PREDICTED: ankycorbin isoform X1 [Tribolium castaneum]|eukprot:XP_008197099.2 PREDICTED: ankycorbin isoform X1 [Tribolium castaneum]
MQGHKFETIRKTFTGKIVRDRTTIGGTHERTSHHNEYPLHHQWKNGREMIDTISDILRFLCLCVMIEKGSWTPTPIINHDPKKRTLKDNNSKPEWLKEWTISKGWIHNRSHLLTLGKENEDDSSSVSTEDIEELISIETEQEQDVSLIFHQVSENYRQNFPENPPVKYNTDLQLPEIYKERLLMTKDESYLNQIWKLIKPKKKSSKTYNCKFTVNQLYEPTQTIPRSTSSTTKAKSRTNLGKNIAIFNTLNSKTNLHEDPIYECSEENMSIYNNPIYAPLTRYYDFHSNRLCNNFKYRKRPDLSQKTEKYIIRHIKVRIMLSLRIGNLKKRYRNMARKSSLRESIERTHAEQRRIGNGKTSIKIQNLRHGRLNVLRWLLWEAEFRAGSNMPALERATNTTLALHYAAARGCLDCVRLLVDSTPDLSANTQMDNDVTPVYLAAQEGHLDVLKFLVLEAGGSLYVRAKDGMAPIHAASQMGCLNCVKWMIQEQGVDPNLRDGDGATPLHFAASRGHLETVRWLLKHGARLSLDKYGKSPINDAAENQQVECLNVLVQHGTTPDYKDGKKSCSCTRKSEQLKRGNSVGSDCSSCKPAENDNSEPFYLHPPLGGRAMEAPHAPQDGLYINPMNNHRHSASSASETSSNESVNGESFYLHNPQEVIYNRVKDLFEAPQRQPLSALTVKVEVHSSSSGAGSDENLSSSDLSERSGDHDHDYEDIYLVREESDKKTDKQANVRSRSRDSGSHSRSGSASSSNSGCNVVVKVTPNKKTNDFLPKPQKYEKIEKKKEEEEAEKTKQGERHSVPPKNVTPNTKVLKRVTSTPGNICPPPPPPPPPLSEKKEVAEEDEPRGAEVVEIVEEATLKPSEIAKGMCKTISALTTRRLNSSCSDLTIVSLSTDTDDTEKHGPNLVNKQRVLPFIPPSFPGSANSNNLIKPSEYLKSISDKRSSASSIRSNSESEEVVMTAEDKETQKIQGPPPPPLPETTPIEQNGKIETNTDTVKKQQQPLSAISIQDLNSVQLRRTDKMVASKTFSAPTRSMSLQCLQSEPFLAQKTDLIAELKLSKDIPGIKKLKIERAKVEETREKQLYTEISKQFTATKFVEKIPDKDNTGNVIPAWKRQMLAKKAAERARKELEEQMLREAEEKRLQAIPQWKRQLMQKKEEAENKMRSTIYTPKVVDDPRSLKIQETHECLKQTAQPEEKKPAEDINNNESVKETVSQTEEEEPDEDTNIIPWRAQLRKTNSKLNLLD